MRSFLTIALVSCASLAFAQNTPIVAGFVGNKEAKIYHTPACKLVLKIKPENKVAFASKDEAVKAGYAPCKICIK